VVAAGVAAFARGVGALIMGVAAVTGVAAEAGSPEPGGDWFDL
jgi:hypothetical protein